MMTAQRLAVFTTGAGDGGATATTRVMVRTTWATLPALSVAVISITLSPGRSVAGTRIARPRASMPRSCGTSTPLTVTCRSEEHTSELQSRLHLVCRLLLEKKKKIYQYDLWHVT